MAILVTGSSGFVGAHLVPALLENGYQVMGVDRLPPKQPIQDSAFRFIEADTSQPGSWQEAIEEADAVVNLAGVNIFRRWSKQAKALIYNSRITTTRNLVEALPEGKGVVFCSTSAVGYYGYRGDETVDESGAAGSDFLAKIAVDWEGEALKAEKKGARVVLDRFGVILGKNGGALASMLPAYRMFVGGPLGNGKQWFPWVHMDDLVSAHLFVLENPQISGPVNFSAPNPVRNREFSATLARVLNRPAFFKMPAFLLRLVAGEFGDMLLNGQRVYPKKLVEQGFEFKYPELEAAVRAVVDTPD
ncbi:MAG: TIGR01777 family oxidoreductase [Desulfobacterales bacterium]|nr:TIGR01777 family oxidoreductase [Desulfobacterales bacterium]